METAEKGLGRSVGCATGTQKIGTRSEGNPGSEERIGPAAGIVLCLVAGLILFAGTAKAQLVYAMEFNQSENLFGTLNLLNGSFTQLGNEGSTLFNDIAAAPDGTLFGIVNSASLVTINQTNGDVLKSVSIGTGGIESMAYSSDGTLYGASQGALYILNPQTGAATLVGNFNNSLLNNVGQNIRFATDGRLYDTDGGVDALNTDVFQISLANGMATLAGEVKGFPGLCLENSGNVMYGVGIQIGAASTLAQDLLGIDLASILAGGLNADGTIASLRYEVLTENFPNNYNVTDNQNYTVGGLPLAPAPEPGVVGSMLAGTALLLFFNRGRRL
jgi:hypothetical protein